MPTLFITSNDRPFSCPNIYTEINSQCYFVHGDINNSWHNNAHFLKGTPCLTVIASNVLSKVSKCSLSKSCHHNNMFVSIAFSWSCPWCVGIHGHMCEFSSSMILSPKDNIKLLYQLPPACSAESTIQSLQCRQTLWIIVPTGSQLRLGAKWRPVSL